MEFNYRKANIEDLVYLWDKNIADNIDDNRWIIWKEKALKDNSMGNSLSFVVTCDDQPVGEGTLIFSPNCDAIRGRTLLCENNITANINALRIQKKHEGKGHISKLVKSMELYAKQNGYKYITIGVEAKETRNLAIYLYWAYNKFVLSEIEDDLLILYYRKEI